MNKTNTLSTIYHFNKLFATARVPSIKFLGPRTPGTILDNKILMIYLFRYS